MPVDRLIWFCLWYYIIFYEVRQCCSSYLSRGALNVRKFSIIPTSPQKNRASMVKLSLVVVEKPLIGPEFSGNSGGPVLGAHGLVVGMACSHLKNVPVLSDAEVRHQI